MNDQLQVLTIKVFINDCHYKVVDSTDRTEWDLNARRPSTFCMSDQIKTYII